MREALAAIAAVLGFFAVCSLPVFAGMLVVPVESWQGPSGIVLQTTFLFVGVVGAYAVYLGMGWATTSMLELRRFGPSVRGFAVGAVAGVLMACCAVAAAVWFGESEVSFGGGTLLEYCWAAVGVGSVLLVAALTEELLFRGYPLSRLSRAVGKVRASIGLAAIFMLAHALNPDASIFGLLNIGLAALMLSAAFFGPGGLAAAWGIHVGWNGGLGIVIDAPVSGVDFEMPLVEFSAGGPVWLTGGNFGPEGGLVGTIAMVAMLVWLLRNFENLREDMPK